MRFGVSLGKLVEWASAIASGACRLVIFAAANLGPEQLNANMRGYRLRRSHDQAQHLSQDRWAPGEALGPRMAGGCFYAHCPSVPLSVISRSNAVNSRILFSDAAVA